MRHSLPDVLLLNLVNWVSIGALTLNEVKDVVAITLGLVSIVSTLLIIRNNCRREHPQQGKGNESPSGKEL